MGVVWLGGSPPLPPSIHLHTTHTHAKVVNCPTRENQQCHMPERNIKYLYSSYIFFYTRQRCGGALGVLRHTHDPPVAHAARTRCGICTGTHVPAHLGSSRTRGLHVHTSRTSGRSDTTSVGYNLCFEFICLQPYLETGTHTPRGFWRGLG